jgi:hypothetical protein
MTHDHSDLDAGTEQIPLTQLRPGMLGVTTPTPSSVPISSGNIEREHGLDAGRTSYQIHDFSSSRWPPSPSCVRSVSDSVSESLESEDFECVHDERIGDADGDHIGDIDSFDYVHEGSGFGARGRVREKLKDGNASEGYEDSASQNENEAQEWDGMEMEMEMD